MADFPYSYPYYSTVPTISSSPSSFYSLSTPPSPLPNPYPNDYSCYSYCNFYQQPHNTYTSLNNHHDGFPNSLLNSESPFTTSLTSYNPNNYHKDTQTITVTSPTPNSPPSQLEMQLSIFDGSEDAYWWIICSEKSFNSRNQIVSDAEKLMECALAMRGSALTWWLSWSLINPKRNWDSFTCALLWHFKPEWRPILPIEGEEKIEQTEDKEPAVTTILPETQSKNEMPEETQQEKTEFITSVDQSICIISTVGEKICSLPRPQPPQLITSSFSSAASSSKPPDPPPGIVLTKSPPLPPEPPDLKSVSDEVLTPPPLKDKVLPPLKPPLPSSKPPPLLKSPDDKTIPPPPSPLLLPSQTLPPAQTPSPLKPPPPEPPDEILTPPVPPPPPKPPDIQLPFYVAHLQYYTHSEIFVVKELFDFLSLKDAHQTQSPPLDPSIATLEKISNVCFLKAQSV